MIRGCRETAFNFLCGFIDLCRYDFIRKVMAGMKEVKWQVVCGVVCILWICLQVYLVVKYWDMPNHDDAYAYVQHASDCMAASTWYPAPHNQYDLFVFGPGYVNLLIVVHSLFGSFSFVRLLNLILNIALVGEIWLLAKQLFGKTTAYWAALLYMLVYSNWYMPIALLTDLPFTFLGVTALLLAAKRKMYAVVLAGVLLALANWFRPLAFVFLFVVLVCFVVQKRGWKQYAALLLPLVLTVFLIGQASKVRTGNFVYQAVSGGFNLAMSCFDDANGLVNFSGFDDPDNYVCLPPGDYTYMERDRLLKEASFRWIRENPLQYVAQIPVKLFALYCEDTWTERVKPDMGFRVVLSEVRGDKWKMAELAAILALKSVVYYFILFFFCYYIWTMRGDWFNRRNVYLLLPLLGTAATVLFVITSRYHYPYLFAITIYAAAGWDVFMRKRQEMSRRVHRQ